MSIKRELVEGMSVKAALADDNGVTILGHFMARVETLHEYGGQVSATLRWLAGPKMGTTSFFGPKFLEDPSVIDMLGDLVRKRVAKQEAIDERTRKTQARAEEAEEEGPSRSPLCSP